MDGAERRCAPCLVKTTAASGLRSDEVRYQQSHATLAPMIPFSLLGFGALDRRMNMVVVVARSIRRATVL
jgi:hypothetical protein